MHLQTHVSVQATNQMNIMANVSQLVQETMYSMPVNVSVQVTNQMNTMVSVMLLVQMVRNL